jgi:hypothetical protein
MAKRSIDATYIDSRTNSSKENKIDSKIDNRIDEILHHYVNFKIDIVKQIITIRIDINTYVENIDELKTILFSAGIPIEKWQVNSCNCYFPEDLVDFEYLKCAYCDGIIPMKPNEDIDRINEQWRIEVQKKLKQVK